MPREPAMLLQDIIDYGERLRLWMPGGGLAGYLSDEKTRCACERCLLIMTEAVVQLRNQDAVLAGRIKDLARICGFRNQLIHAYYGVDHQIVFGIINRLIPQLADDAYQILNGPRPQDSKVSDT